MFFIASLVKAVLQKMNSDDPECAGGHLRRKPLIERKTRKQLPLLKLFTVTLHLPKVHCRKYFSLIFRVDRIYVRC
jgi:hypothetical protein